LSLAAFIADQKTAHRVPYATSCRALGVSQSWFYKWHDRPPTPAQQRRAAVDEAVASEFKASGGTYGSPRVHFELIEKGWKISEKTVAESMRRQGLVARVKKRRKGLTRPDKRKRPFPDLLNRDFTASAPNLKWVGDMTEIPTEEGKLYLATVIDLFSRRLLGYATSVHPDADLAGQAIKMAVAARSGNIAGVIFHTDRGSTYTAGDFTGLCTKLEIIQSMGRVGSCFEVSRRRESHPPPLSEPCVTVSRYTAPVVRPWAVLHAASGRTCQDRPRRSRRASGGPFEEPAGTV
jgi:putative transposase